MASPDVNSSWLYSFDDSFGRPFSTQILESNPANVLPELKVSTSSFVQYRDVPQPPPLPIDKYTRKNYLKKTTDCRIVPKETRNAWDSLFKEGYDADVYIVTENDSIIPAHLAVLSLASPVLRAFVQQSKVKNGIRYIKISGVPSEAVYVFIRFLYSSCYEVEDLKNFALLLLVLSHSYAIPSLKRVSAQYLEDRLSTENVIDILQIARGCDANRLSSICIRMVIKDFKTISSTEGWKVMRRSNPILEQDLLESVVEADTQKEERKKKMEEKKVYLQLHEALEALVHICKDGCRTIGPREKVLKDSLATCRFPACKGLEVSLRHFSNCKTRIPGGCVQCKRMWQLLELHSRICSDPDSCKVPLCRHFKDKMQRQSKKDEAKWRLLVHKVVVAKNALGPFSSMRRS